MTDNKPPKDNFFTNGQLEEYIKNTPPDKLRKLTIAALKRGIANAKKRDRDIAVTIQISIEAIEKMKQSK